MMRFGLSVASARTGVSLFGSKRVCLVGEDAIPWREVAHSIDLYQ